MFKDLFENLRKNLGKFFSNRIYVVGALLLLCAAVLFFRLFSLQIIKKNEYSEKYLNTTKKEVSIPAIRGDIYDRNGKLIAGSQVVHNITMVDENYYTKSNGDFNAMILRLLQILDKYGAEPTSTIPVILNETNTYVFKGTEAKIRQFIRDVYGKKRIDARSEDGEDAYQDSAEKVMKYLMENLYNFNSKWEGAKDVSKKDALRICNIRYTLSATAYTRYISTKIVKNASDKLQAAIYERQEDLHGVNVEESIERIYYDAECFSSVLGYVGSITTEEIEELNAQGGNYIAGDLIGKEGIEAAYESQLQGTKGKKIIYVNSTGIILSEEVVEEPEKGNDIYLSIDADLTVAAYNVMEQQLAGVVVNHLYEEDDYDPEVAYEKSEYLIPIRDVYFQMINNNILSMSSFADKDASEGEKKMETFRKKRKAEVLRDLRELLQKKDSTKRNEYSKYEDAYQYYLYTYLSDNKYLLSDAIDTNDEIYKNWKNGDCSFPEFLLYALKQGWADMSLLEGGERYDTIESCYDGLVDILLLEISKDYGDFDKKIYDELIHTDVISGCDVGIALYRQNIFKKDDEDKEKLAAGTNEAAFDFFRTKIQSMELLPSQIALDPCSAGLVLTDPNTGELLTNISYPGFDSNRINDSAYYAKLLTDQSSPLYSRATQSRLAPGSTFKMVTATAALEGGYLQEEENITCEGIYDKLDHPRCWIYRLENGSHGPKDVIGALGQSCNCFFYECGYRFSMNKNNQYSPSTGVNVINQFAKLYGFGSLTGVETKENVSVLTNELPVTSAIGQGTNAFTTISLARYLTAIASSGNVYEFKFLNRIVDKDGNVIQSYTPEVIEHLNFKESTWDLLHKGMYTVVHDGGSRNGDFANLKYQYAAKSGSAQENRLRAEHGWYVTYGPYDDISYAMAIQIPNGYSSGNAALIARGVYEYLEGDITLEEILKKSAASESINDVLD